MIINKEDKEVINSFKGLNVEEQIKRYIKEYEPKVLYRWIIADKDSELNKGILTVEKIYDEIESITYNNESEEGLFLKEVFEVSDKLMIIKDELRSYILSFNDITLF